MKRSALLSLPLLVLLFQASGQVETTPGESVAFEGLIEPFRVVDLSPAVDGVIEELRVDRGDLIKEGQVLAKLESSVERETLRIAEARAKFDGQLKAQLASLDFSKSKLEEERELSLKGIVSPRQLEQAVTEMRLAEAGVVQARENLELAKLEHARARAALKLRTILSPLNGVVVERYLSTGELATRQGQSKILRVAQISPLNVEVILSLGMLGQVKVGSSAQVHPEAPVGGVHTAKVTVVDRVVDAESATFRARLEMPNPENRLPAGIKCRVSFAAGK